MTRQLRLTVAPIPELYIRWRDPETNRVVKMDRVLEADVAAALLAEGFVRMPRAAT